MLSLIELEEHKDERGSLCMVQKLPFPIKRVYYIFDVAHGAVRGGHAHKTLERLFIAVSGGFTATLDDSDSIRLCRPTQALYVAPKRWLDLTDFSPGAVCLILASAEFDPQDYVRDKGEWRALR